MVFIIVLLCCKKMIHIPHKVTGNEAAYAQSTQDELIRHRASARRRVEVLFGGFGLWVLFSLKIVN